MRFLFSFHGGIGHFEPAVPIARALREAGHDVAFAAHPRMVPLVAARGFSVSAVRALGVPLGDPAYRRAAEALREEIAALPGLSLPPSSSPSRRTGGPRTSATTARS